MNWDELMQRLAAESPASEDASIEIVGRYTQRLLRLVDSRLSPTLGRRIDAEDVVQSVFRSFFRRSNEFRFQRSGDLWRLLASMSVKKLRKQASKQGAGKRDFRKEKNLGADAFENLPFHKEPTPDAAVALQETLARLIDQLPPTKRRVLQMRLEGDSLAKISIELQKSQRTIRRLLQSIRAQIVTGLLDEDSA